MKLAYKTLKRTQLNVYTSAPEYEAYYKSIFSTRSNALKKKRHHSTFFLLFHAVYNYQLNWQEKFVSTENQNECTCLSVERKRASYRAKQFLKLRIHGINTIM